MFRDQGEVSIDCSGPWPMYKRGYREYISETPMRETLAYLGMLSYILLPLYSLVLGSDHDKPGIYFQITRQGTPFDPKFLPSRHLWYVLRIWYFLFLFCSPFQALYWWSLSATFYTITLISNENAIKPTINTSSHSPLLSSLALSYGPLMTNKPSKPTSKHSITIISKPWKLSSLVFFTDCSSLF